MLGPMRRVFTALAKTLLHILGVAIPLLGFWIASSIAAYLNGPIWLVLLCGLLVCPVLPALFEIWRAFQRKKYQERPSYGGAIAYSAYVDASRVATVLLVGALVIDAKGVAAAVSTRGDWMLEGTAGSVVERARQSLLWVADRITAIGESNEDNPYAQFDDSEKTDPGERGWRYEPPTPEPEKPRRRAKRRSKKQSKKSTQRRRPDAGFWDSGLPPIPREVTRRGDRRRPLDIPQPRLRPDAGSPDSGVRRRTDDIPEIVIHEEPPPKPKRRRIARPERYAYWLVSASPHRVVRSMPASAKSSWRSVASHIAKLESDPFERVKAIHDFIATEIGYEANFDINNLPPSDPDAVFQRGWAVCSGYARLFKAMVEHTGGEAVYISGRSRFAVQNLRGTTHAWNAVRIAGGWYLLDVTWDAGHVEGRRFIEKYSTDHLFPPPEVFGLTHLPKDDRWQLVDDPMSLGEFLRQPLYWPRFFAYGFDLVQPQRSQITVDGSATVVVDNPKGRHITVKWVKKTGGGTMSGRCDVRQGPQIVARCALPSPGDYSVKLFGALAANRVHWSVAQIDVNNRG